jgi:putative ubiquitin-RnfH superfamily antitoxin RatB of RatAB toxin-antitoxin module
MTAPSITVMYSPAPRVVHEKTLPLTEGMTVLQAIEASGFPHHNLSLSVWGRKATPEQALRDLDRVEICRPLTVDPKVARRERFQKQGSRGAGLFSKRRPGAKPGY